MRRTWGTVSAGVRFFPPPGFQRQEPGGDERQGLMMMPPLPGADLVVGQTRFAFGPLQALFDPVLRFEHPREFGPGRVERRVRQQVIMFPTAVTLSLAEHHQEFRCLRRLAFGTRLHQRARGLHYHRPFRAVTHVDGLPSVRWQRGAPVVHPRERRSPVTPATAARAWLAVVAVLVTADREPNDGHRALVRLEAVGVPVSKSMSTFKLMPNNRHGNVFTISANTTA